MSDKRLETVDAYNARKRREREAARFTGVACPACGGELAWAQGMFGRTYVCTTWPAECAACPGYVELEDYGRG